MQIVDAQIHLWGSGLPSNQSHRQVTAFTPEEAIALMDEGGVDAAVIHPPGWDPNSTDMAFAAVRNYPGRFAIMGSVPLDRPESRDRIVGWRSQPGMLGLRYGFLTDPARRWLTQLYQRRNRRGQCQSSANLLAASGSMKMACSTLRETSGSGPALVSGGSR